MNSETLSAEAFKLAIFVAALVFVRWNLYEGFRVDAFRQRLFELRGELFNFAAGGGIPFGHPAYVSLRNRINRLIRFAHTYSLVHLLLALAIEGSDAPPSEVDQAIEDLPPGETKERVEWIHMRVTLYFAWHLVCSSWIALAFGLGGYAISRLGEGIKKLAETGITRLPGLARLEQHTYAH